MQVQYIPEYRVVPTMFVTRVIDDFGNEIELPMSAEIGHRARPILSAFEFIESGEVH